MSVPSHCPPPPPYTLTKDSSTRPHRRTLFVDGEKTVINTTASDVIRTYHCNDSRRILSLEDVNEENDTECKPILRNTIESQTFYFYGHNPLDDGTGGEVRVQSYPVFDRATPCSSVTSRISSSSNSTMAEPRPYAYPPGFICFKCKNTGIVGSKKSCSRCFRRFSTQKIQYRNPVVNAVCKVTAASLAALTGRNSHQWVDTGTGICHRCLSSGVAKSPLDYGGFGFRRRKCNVCEGSGVLWP